MTQSDAIAALFDQRNQSRALIGCLFASLFLHACLLFLFPGLRSGGPAAEPARILTATFAPRVASPEPVVATPSVPPRPEQKIEQPRPVLTTPTPAVAAPHVAAPPVTPPAPTNAVPEAAPKPPVASAPAVSSQRAAEPQSPAPQIAAPARSGSDSADSGSLDQYRMALIMAARRYKRYPSQAMEKGWQGKVEIRLLVGANGMIQTATVKTSSGYQLLDDTALDMIRKGKTLAPIPPMLRGKEFVVDVPVVFDLQAG